MGCTRTQIFKQYKNNNFYSFKTINKKKNYLTDYVKQKNLIDQ